MANNFKIPDDFMKQAKRWTQPELSPAMKNLQDSMYEHINNLLVRKCSPLRYVRPENGSDVWFMAIDPAYSKAPDFAAITRDIARGR